MTVGVEIIARRLVRVLLRSWVAPSDGARATRRDRPFFGIYLPAHPENRQAVAAQPDRPRRPVRHRRHGRARHRQRALPDPLHADARAAGGLDVGAVQRGAQAQPPEHRAVPGAARRPRYNRRRLPSTSAPPRGRNARRRGRHPDRHGPTSESSQHGTSFLHQAHRPRRHPGRRHRRPAIAQARRRSSGAWRRAFPSRSTRSSARAEIFAKRVAALTDNKFQIQVFAAGEIVPGLQVVDAVQNGTVECGHTAPYYYFGKDPTFAFGTRGAVRPEHAPAERLDVLRRRPRADARVLQGIQHRSSFLTGNTGAQMGGWFRKEIKTLET